MALWLAACGGGGGSDSSASAPAPATASTVSLSADPAFVSVNGMSTLTWSAQNQFQCKGSGGWQGTKPMKGSTTVGPLTDTTVYTLTCVGPGGKQDKSVTIGVGNQPPPPAPTVSLTANPPSIGINDSTTLTWSSTDATSCDASDGWSGTMSTAGSQSVGPLTQTTNFTLTCSGDGGSASQTVTVTVNASPPPPPPTISFTASSMSIAYKGSTTLTWSSTDAGSCSASDGWSGTKATSGSETQSGLTVTTTFMLTCTGAGGSASQSLTVTVAPPPSPIISFTASPTGVTLGGSSTLTWSTTNASSCNASGAWAGNQPISGSQVVGPINATSTYTLSCTGSGGNASKSVTVTVQGTGTADLSWVAPTTNTDGSAASLSGFNIYQGTSTSNLQKIDSVSASQMTYTVNNLAVGTYYFAVTAVGTDGAESTFSNIGSKTIN